MLLAQLFLKDITLNLTLKTIYNKNIMRFTHLDLCMHLYMDPYMDIYMLLLQARVVILLHEAMVVL